MGSYSNIFYILKTFLSCNYGVKILAHEWAESANTSAQFLCLSFKCVCWRWKIEGDQLNGLLVGHWHGVVSMSSIHFAKERFTCKMASCVSQGCFWEIVVVVISNQVVDFCADLLMFVVFHSVCEDWWSIYTE